MASDNKNKGKEAKVRSAPEALKAIGAENSTANQTKAKNILNRMPMEGMDFTVSNFKKMWKQEQGK